jgi:hypothetical protein
MTRSLDRPSWLKRLARFAVSACAAMALVLWWRRRSSRRQGQLPSTDPMSSRELREKLTELQQTLDSIEQGSRRDLYVSLALGAIVSIPIGIVINILF